MTQTRWQTQLVRNEYLAFPTLSNIALSDRVFGHALHTINKIRSGSQKPPVADRLRLYGLYKQSMEGDVSDIQDRASGDSEQTKKEQEKWDAWNDNHGLSRTEAKKRYIETLIQTMHTYASATPEARELVSELEFVWDQVKHNSNPSSSHQSSPHQIHDQSQSYPGMPSDNGAMFDDDRGRGQDQMRILSPVSQPGPQEEDEERDETFVDAPVSQYGEQDLETQPEDHTQPTTPDEKKRSESRPRRTIAMDSKWQRRVESALTKMTAEVAALREQLESRQYLSRQRRYSIFGRILRFGGFLVVADIFILWMVLLYLRRRKDRRLEGAIRVMLGDAQAVAKNLASQMQQKVGTKVQFSTK